MEENLDNLLRAYDRSAPTTTSWMSSSTSSGSSSSSSSSDREALPSDKFRVVLDNSSSHSSTNTIDDGSSSSGTSRQKTTTSGSSSNNAYFSDLIIQYVNPNLVRKMIAQNLVEFLIICVIITYLIYYFSYISRRPRLIGNSRSKFVEFIKKNLDDTLSHRFNPLIYFWGTNPQTALFAYLQGQTSIDEMPRNKFRRQYLYVSDAQYLTSNVDLSQHYINNNQTSSQQQQNNKRQHLVQLQVNESVLQQVLTQNSLLDQNIRLALDDLFCKKTSAEAAAAVVDNNSEHIPSVSASASERLRQIKEHDLSSSGSSSSDSGVFAGGHSSSSSSSLSDVVAISQEQHDDIEHKCSCKIRYDTEPHLEPPSDLFTNPYDKRIALELASANGDPTTGTTTTTNNATITGAREQLEFGQCALDWHKNSHKQYHKNKLVALISAGMTTGSDKKYVTDTVTTLEKLGYEVCVFIRRGVGGLKLSSTKFFSPAKWRDFEAAVLSVRQQRPGAHLVAVGFCFGSIELCRYLSMSGKRSLVDAALLISCPFDPAAGCRNMRKRALNRRIDTHLAKNLGKQLYQAMFAGPPQKSRQPTLERQCGTVSNHNGSVVNLATLPKIKSIVDFEDNYNRVLQNYPNSEAYAADSRLQDHLSFIETPTLCLNSEDDIMAPLRLLPLDQIRANKNLCMVLTKRGGHMAFVDGLLWPKRPYFAQRIIGNYMKAVRLSLLGASGRDLAGDISTATGDNHQKQLEQHTRSHHLIQMYDGK